MKKLIAVMLIVAVGMFAASADAKTISINFDTGGANVLAPADIAGVVPAANWNNVTAMVSGQVLVDSTGAATTATLDSYSFSLNTANASTGGTAPNQAMMNEGLLQGVLGGSGTYTGQVMLQNLAAEMALGYDVYLYVGDSSWGHMAGATANVYESNTAADFTGVQGGPVLANVTQTIGFTGAANGTVFNGTYSAGGNYVQFTGKSAALAVYQVWATSAGGGASWSGAMLHGMQIVGEEPPPEPGVPEPAGLGLVGLALLAVRKRRS
jgi:MYXO-CTERM domain-containing protein